METKPTKRKFRNGYEYNFPKRRRISDSFINPYDCYVTSMVPSVTSSDNITKCENVSILNHSITEYRTRSKDTSITQLPNEILLHIFSYVSLPDLYVNIRMVCSNWYKVVHSQSLWEKIKAGNNISTAMLSKWLEIAGQKLKKIKLKQRNDVGFVIKKLSRLNKNVENIKIVDCWGSAKQVLLPSVPLCNLLQRCKYISEITIVGSRFTSCKFFKILAMKNHIRLLQSRNHNASRNIRIPKTINFIGNASYRQLRTFLQTRQTMTDGRNSVKLYSVQDGQNVALLNGTELNVNIDDILEAVYGL